MKKIVFILIVNFVCLHFSFGQCGDCVDMYDIQTPMGSNIVTLLCSELCPEDRDQLYWDNYWFARYYPPNAIQIPTYDGYSSTGKFNCHGYAWLRVEQGIDRWINPGSNLGKYITDSSYVQVPLETFPGKVSWTSTDHSAITTEVPGWFISKWEVGPLCRHYWSYCPYGSSTLKYYVRNCPTYGITIINLTNQTITTNTTHSACSINIMQNVTVTNNAKLILNRENEVNIIKDFEVQLGSEFEIK